MAKLVLGARERYAIEFFKGGDASDVGYFQCKLDHSLWLSREDALRHALTSERFSDYYSSEEVETDPPKGNFSVVAVCGMSGVLLGPPNHHDYQKDLNRLYKERFSNMPFEAFKRRIRMENDEETIEKWKTLKSKQTHYTYNRSPEGAEPVLFKSPEEMERHCREHHTDDLVEALDKAKVPGNIPAKALAPQLLACLRHELDQQKRFPMNTVKVLCRQLEDQGLKFFKDEDGKKKKTTYVCRSRPRALQGATHLSDRIRKIVGLVRDNPGIDYSIVVSSMLPGQRISEATAQGGRKTTQASDTDKSAEEEAAPVQTETTGESVSSVESVPAAAPAAPAAEESKAESSSDPPAAAEVNSEPSGADSAPAGRAAMATSETVKATVLEAKENAIEEKTPETQASVDPAVAGEPPTGKKPEASEVASEPTSEVEGPSDEEIGILKDLRWLIREGYVVEYSTGAMRLARNHSTAQAIPQKEETSRGCKASGIDISSQFGDFGDSNLPMELRRRVDQRLLPRPQPRASLCPPRVPNLRKKKHRPRLIRVSGQWLRQRRRRHLKRMRKQLPLQARRFVLNPQQPKNRLPSKRRLRRKSSRPTSKNQFLPISSQRRVHLCHPLRQFLHVNRILSPRRHPIPRKRTHPDSARWPKAYDIACTLVAPVRRGGALGIPGIGAAAPQHRGVPCRRSRLRRNRLPGERSNPDAEH